MNVKRVAEALRHVYDPELGIDVVSLGLVYGIEVADGRATITMTTTSPSCPLGSVILESAEAMIANRFPESTVEMVTSFDPPWNVEMADDEARNSLGLGRAGG